MDTQLVCWLLFLIFYRIDLYVINNLRLSKSMLLSLIKNMQIKIKCITHTLSSLLFFSLLHLFFPQAKCQLLCIIFKMLSGCFNRFPNIFFYAFFRLICINKLFFLKKKMSEYPLISANIYSFYLPSIIFKFHKLISNFHL